MRQQAQRARLARRAVRGGRRAERADGGVVPAIPDFVDGSFLADETAGREPRRIAVDRHAA